jgi:DNA-binding MurR/RpiR family transcriptional regulator
MKNNELPSRADILNRLSRGYLEMSPQMRKAARYILDNPNNVGVNSIHELANAAMVHPNTLVRIANRLGFTGYKEFRRPFSESLRAGIQTFPDRARWLQSIAQHHSHGTLLRKIAETNIISLEHLFSRSTAAEVKTVADCILRSRRTYALGAGISYSVAHSFWYVAHMAFDHVVLVPGVSTLPLDDISQIGSKDVLLAITFHPYRTDVVSAFEYAKRRKARLISVTDSRASPITIGAHHSFIVAVDSPQFYISLVAAQSLIEAIIAFMVAEAKPDAVANIAQFHEQRSQAGVYLKE